MAYHIDSTPGNAGYEVGPRSIAGVEARDLPDKGRGTVDQNIGKLLGRQIPDHLNAQLPPSPSGGADARRRGGKRGEGHH